MTEGLCHLLACQELQYCMLLALRGSSTLARLARKKVELLAAYLEGCVHHLELPEADALPRPRQGCSILHKHLRVFPKLGGWQQHLRVISNLHMPSPAETCTMQLMHANMLQNFGQLWQTQEGSCCFDQFPFHGLHKVCHGDHGRKAVPKQQLPSRHLLRENPLRHPNTTGSPIQNYPAFFMLGQ